MARDPTTSAEHMWKQSEIFSGTFPEGSRVPKNLTNKRTFLRGSWALFPVFWVTGCIGGQVLPWAAPMGLSYPMVLSYGCYGLHYLIIEQTVSGPVRCVTKRPCNRWPSATFLNRLVVFLSLPADDSRSFKGPADLHGFHRNQEGLHRVHRLQGLERGYRAFKRGCEVFKGL